MSQELAVRFLQAFARALSRLRLYEPGHPARERAVSEAHGSLLETLMEEPELPFTFLDGVVALDERRIRELDEWEPARQLERIGIEKLEFRSGVERGEIEGLLETIFDALSDSGRATVEGARQYPHVRFGKIQSTSTRESFREIGLQEEAEAVEWLQEQVRGNGEVNVTVADAVVLSIGNAIRQSENVLDLLVPLKQTDQYSTAHSMNVSVLAMGLVESMGFTGDDVRSLGEAAVLHDLGKSRIPEEILQKPDSLTDDEWDIIKKHPEEGARLLLESDEDLDLAALVAYEHHMKWSGGGYPEVRFRRRPHPVSQLIQICDVYDALRTRRPFREPWPVDKIMHHIQEESGNRFNPETVEQFARMINRWETDRRGPEAAERRPGRTSAAGTE